MPRGTIDWKSTDSYTRLLAAMVAAQDMKLNYKKIADMYGEGATYDAIEGRFRIIRKEAEKLRTEITTGERPPAPPRGANNFKSPRSGDSSPRKPRTPKGHSQNPIDLDNVLNGRVSKSANSTPTKKRNAAQIKKEMLESSTSSSSSGDASVFDQATSNNDNGAMVDDFSSFDQSIMSFHNMTPQMSGGLQDGAMSMLMDSGSGYWDGEEEQYA